MINNYNIICKNHFERLTAQKIALLKLGYDRADMIYGPDQTYISAYNFSFNNYTFMVDFAEFIALAKNL
jgi:hypothetical protein